MYSPYYTPVYYTLYIIVLGLYTGGMTFKFISLNLWWGGNLFDQIVEFLESEQADVIALQEVFDGHDPSLPERLRSMDALKARLNYPHQRFAHSHILAMPEGKLPSGNALLSRFPIVDQTVTYLFEATRDEYQDVPEQWPIFPRILQGVKLDTPAGEINVFNIHGVWDLDGDNPSEARKTMVEKTLQAVADKPNVLLTGDTNATTGNPLLRDIDKRLTSVFGNELTSTFNMRRKDRPGYATAAVDHMWVSPEIKVLSHSCPDVDISDHLPLIATLELSTDDKGAL
jgi:endonuclease/exonuclease/phosphatase family metal-dependent hydrolase